MRAHAHVTDQLYNTLFLKCSIHI